MPSSSTTSSNGASSRPASLSLSIPALVTASTRAFRCSAAAIGWTRRERLEVALGDLVARSGTRRRPARSSRRLEQLLRLRVDVVLPRREHAHVAPGPDAGADRRARLEDQRLDVARQQMGGGGQPDRTRADHRDGQLAVVVVACSNSGRSDSASGGATAAGALAPGASGVRGTAARLLCRRLTARRLHRRGATGRGLDHENVVLHCIEEISMCGTVAEVVHDIKCFRYDCLACRPPSP